MSNNNFFIKFAYKKLHFRSKSYTIVYNGGTDRLIPHDTQLCVSLMRIKCLIVELPHVPVMGDFHEGYLVPPQLYSYFIHAHLYLYHPPSHPYLLLLTPRPYMYKDRHCAWCLLARLLFYEVFYKSEAARCISPAREWLLKNQRRNELLYFMARKRFIVYGDIFLESSWCNTVLV